MQQDKIKHMVAGAIAALPVWFTDMTLQLGNLPLPFDLGWVLVVLAAAYVYERIQLKFGLGKYEFADALATGLGAIAMAALSGLVQHGF